MRISHHPIKMFQMLVPINSAHVSRALTQNIIGKPDELLSRIVVLHPRIAIDTDTWRSLLGVGQENTYAISAGTGIFEFDPGHPLGEANCVACELFVTPLGELLLLKPEKTAWFFGKNRRVYLDDKETTALFDLFDELAKCTFIREQGGGEYAMNCYSVKDWTLGSWSKRTNANATASSPLRWILLALIVSNPTLIWLLPFWFLFFF